MELWYGCPYHASDIFGSDARARSARVHYTGLPVWFRWNQTPQIWFFLKAFGFEYLVWFFWFFFGSFSHCLVSNFLFGSFPNIWFFLHEMSKNWSHKEKKRDQYYTSLNSDFSRKKYRKFFVIFFKLCTYICCPSIFLRYFDRKCSFFRNFCSKMCLVFSWFFFGGVWLFLVKIVWQPCQRVRNG